MLNRILILGGTGFVGRALCENLAARHPGLRLRVPTRRWRRGQGIVALPTVDLVQADVHDDAQLARLVQGCDAVVNLVAILHGSPAAFERTHVALPRRLAAACTAAGVRRVLHVSALGVGPGAPSNYLRSKTEGEAVLKAAGLDLTVLRPSVIFGVHDRFINLFAEMQAVAPVVPLAFGGARFQPVWVGDVAEALARCLDRRETLGQTYECTGPDEMTLADIVRHAGRWAGHARPVLPLPGLAGTLQAVAMELLPGEPLMSRDNIASMQVPNVATGTLPGLAALGIAPRAAEAVMAPHLAERFRQPWLDRFRASRG